MSDVFGTISKRRSLTPVHDGVRLNTRLGDDFDDERLANRLMAIERYWYTLGGPLVGQLASGGIWFFRDTGRTIGFRDGDVIYRTTGTVSGHLDSQDEYIPSVPASRSDIWSREGNLWSNLSSTSLDPTVTTSFQTGPNRTRRSSPMLLPIRFPIC
jgi:hypothetical protein